VAITRQVNYIVLKKTGFGITILSSLAPLLFNICHIYQGCTAMTGILLPQSPGIAALKLENRASLFANKAR
jgi:hypothetical protein